MFARWKLLSTPDTEYILIDRIYTAVDRGRLVTSIRRDMTASEPIQTRWAPNVGGKTHLIQAHPKEMCLSLHFPIHPRWAAKQTLIGKYLVYARLPSYPQPTNFAVM